MISSGRRGLHESLIRLCRIQAPQAIASQRTTSLISAPAACLHTHCLPCQPASLMAARHFAAASAKQYSPEGQMSAVTFHGPRSMKVSKKAKPRLETPGVRTCTLLAFSVVLQMISSDGLTTCIPYWLKIILHPKICNLFLLPRTTPYMYALRCMHYVFGACNPTFTVFYGQSLVWFGINFILQGTIEVILRDDFEPVRY